MNKEELISFGFTEKEINNLNEKILSIFSYSGYKIETKINFFINYGYGTNQITKIFLAFPDILKIDVLNIEDKFNIFEKLGLKKEEIIKLTVFFPIILGLSNKNIENKISFFERLGYKNLEIVRMIKKFPIMIGYKEECLIKKIYFLEDLGYKKEEAKKITIESPLLFSFSDSNVENKINDLMKLGYTKDEVLKMTLLFPSIFGHDISNLKRKINFLKEINLDFVILNHTKELIQSVELTYARYMFLKEQEITLDESNYKQLFLYSKRFEKIYNISNEQLLEKYKYEDKYQKNDKNSRKIRNEVNDKNMQKIEYLKSLQLSDEQIEKIVFSFPQLYNISIETLKAKIEFYQSINILHIILKEPERLIQSVELSYAKYMFFMDNGITINENNYHKLFYSNKQIKELYHITKEELLEKYPYENNLDNKNIRERKEDW